ncbi:redoxin domain-containing protein [Patescibacteria group bacterium]|nr:MAG: redoxin domain-containing protein [Patescibacteria group bacterium]
MNIKIVFVVISVAIIVWIGFVAISSNTTNESVNKDEMSMKGTDASREMVKSDQVMNEGSMEDELVMKVGSYEPYSVEKLANADMGHVVLFFRASWCPTCRALDADIRANLQTIPKGVTILDVNYDTATVMKQKYGVTQQHTLVEVDAKGDLISKWTGSPTLATLVTNIK